MYLPARARALTMRDKRLTAAPAATTLLSASPADALPEAAALLGFALRSSPAEEVCHVSEEELREPLVLSSALASVERASRPKPT
jgi:hypothetical protein